MLTVLVSCSLCKLRQQRKNSSVCIKHQYSYQCFTCMLAVSRELVNKSCHTVTCPSGLKPSLVNSWIVVLCDMVTLILKIENETNSFGQTRFDHCFCLEYFLVCIEALFAHLSISLLVAIAGEETIEISLLLSPFRLSSIDILPLRHDTLCCSWGFVRSMISVRVWHNEANHCQPSVCRSSHAEF